MKQLSIEEKARRYDEVIERAKKLYEQGTITESLSYVFPELAEPDDEKIRKWLIGYFHQYKEDGIEKCANGLKVDDIVAWLEKQGEHEPIWSEEDEKMIRALMSICDEWATRHSYLTKEDNDIEKIKSWLKSLKERI